MAGPWDKYKKDEKKSDGPWNKFKGTPSSPGAILPTPSEPMDVDVKNLQSAFGFIPATALGSASDLSLGYAERVFTPKMKEYIKDNPEAYNVGGPALSMAVLSPLSAIGKAKGAYDATKPLKLLDNASVLERIMGNKVGKDVVTGAATGGAIGFAADPGEGKFSDIPERLKNMVSGGAIGSILKPIIGKGARVQDDVDLVKNPTKIFDESKRMKKEYVNQLNQDVISPLDQRARSLLADKKAVLDLDQYPEIADTAENIKLKSQGGFGMGSPRAEVGGEDILALRKALDKEANFDISKPTDVTSYAKRESAAAKAASLRKKIGELAPETKDVFSKEKEAIEFRDWLEGRQPIEAGKAKETGTTGSELSKIEQILGRKDLSDLGERVKSGESYLLKPRNLIPQSLNVLDEYFRTGARGLSLPAQKLRDIPGSDAIATQRLLKAFREQKPYTEEEE